MTGFRDGRAKLWSAHTGRLMKTYKKPVQPGAGIITADATSRASRGATSNILELGTAHGGAQALPSIEPQVTATVPRDCCPRPVIRVS
jgi:hypothetical protein